MSQCWSPVLALLLVGCSGGSGKDPGPGARQPLPVGVPADAVVVEVDRGRLLFDGTDVAPWPPAAQDLDGVLHLSLDQAMEPGPTDVLLRLPPSTRFRDFEPTLRTSEQNQLERQWLQQTGKSEAVGAFGRPSSKSQDGSWEVVGVRPHLVLSVGTRGEASWVEGFVAFEALAQAQGGEGEAEGAAAGAEEAAADADAAAGAEGAGAEGAGAEGVGAEAAAPELVSLRASEIPGLVSCAEVFSDNPVQVEACLMGQEQGSAVRDPLQVAAASGCLAPAATNEGERGSWTEIIARNLKGSGLDAWGVPVLAMAPDSTFATLERVALGIREGMGVLPVLTSQQGLGSSAGPAECETGMPEVSQLEWEGAFWLGQASAAAEARSLTQAALAASRGELSDDLDAPYKAELVGVTVIKGSLGPQAARDGLQVGWPDLEQCFQNAARRGLSGTATIQVEVLATGKVSRGLPQTSSPGAQAVGACLASRARGANFAASSGTSTLLVEVRFLSL